MSHSSLLFVTVAVIGFIQPACAAEIDFAHDIVPVLKQHCGSCHTGDKKKGGLSFNTREALLAGGEGGKVVVAGKSGASELIERIVTQDETLRMPPDGPRLSAKEIALLKGWVDAGLPWEAGFSFKQAAYEPPLKPRRPELPAAVDGRTNPIDRIVDAYFAEKKLPRPVQATDAVFIRRVSMDLVGLLPTPEQLQAFEQDTRPDKRERLVRDLLADDVAYAEHWLTFWNDLLRNDYTGTGFITGGRKQITKWLYEALVNNKPYDQFVRELIAPGPESEGYIQGIRWRGNVSASQSQEVQFAQSISQSFLGINMKCASCHDSFIDRWKLSEAYGLAAIYATAPLPIHRCDKPTGADAQAAWIFPELGQIDAKASQPERLKQLAGLMTHPENGRFTRTIVNRLWQRLLGRGIVHPVDAMHTEPWNANLLDFLAVNFADQNHDLKATLALICTSQAYQAQTTPVEAPQDGNAYVFHGPLARRMTAEQFMDSVWQLTGTAPTRFDAQVVRAKLPAAVGQSTTPAEALTGQWIWSYAEGSGAVPKAGETIALRRTIELKQVPVRAVGVITCDNGYILYVNNQKLAADEAWDTVEAVGLERALRVGKNEFMIVAKNLGNSPNPAALFFEARLKAADGTVTTLASNAEWQWTATLPNAAGKFAAEPPDWKPAVPVQNPEVWASVNPALASTLAGGSNAATKMVRASLVKADELMRALGRPNRDQIVTMRPSDLTTLEAIDLANGQTLADALALGAKRWLTEAATPVDATVLVTKLYLAALSRPPTAEELALARDALGNESTAQSVEDLLWAVLMLPEFQLVR